MLIKKYDKKSGKILHTTKPTLVSAKQGYSRPQVGSGVWWDTTTTVWCADESIRRQVRDWRRLFGETGHTGERTQAMRQDHNSFYTGTHSVFPAPLAEWILLRYGPLGSCVLDAFAGGVVRGAVAGFMGYTYTGVDIRQEQIDENLRVLAKLGLTNVSYICGDGIKLDVDGEFDIAVTCPPYFDLEVYSTLPNDLSALPSYTAFDQAMAECARSHRRVMKPGGFVCFVVGNFRDKYGELIDFPGHTITNFKKAGFLFWQDVIIKKNFSSAAKRASTAWKGMKLVPCHERLLVFRKPKK